MEIAHLGITDSEVFMICDLPENEIVRICAGVLPGEEKSARLKDICGPDVDWSRVFETAKAHGVLFLLYKGLKAHGCGVPGDFLQQLRQLYLRNSAENLRVGARLVRILGVLADAGMDAVPFKGPVQAEAVYGDIGARYFCDLDILVRRADAVAARDVLVENGFFIDVPIADDQVETYLRHENFFSFTDRAKSIHIDLHWELTGRYLLCPVHMEDLAGRLERQGLAGVEMDALGAEDRLIYLCAHSASHCWDKLESVCAVAEIVRSGKITDWEGLERRAARFRFRTMVFLGLMLAKDVLGAELPGDVEKRISRQRFLGRIERQAVGRLFDERGLGDKGLSWRFSPMHFLIRDSAADAVRYAARMFFTPTIRDWIDYHLPSRWLFLYRVLRPWRIVSGWVVSRWK
jgi:hypothetical protein